MRKFWDDLLEIKCSKGEVVLSSINHDEYRKGYGTYVFTTPIIKEWLRRNDNPRNPPKPKRVWDDQQETIYFAFKEQDITYHGHDEKDEAKAGFFINVYTDNDDLRRTVFQRIWPVVCNFRLFKGATIHSQGENDTRDRACYWRSWEIDVNEENVRLIVDDLIPKISRLFLK